MAGGFDFLPYPPLSGSNATQFVVYRFKDNLSDDDRFQVLPNIQVDAIQIRQGAEPQTASLHYVLDNAQAGWPKQFEQIFRIHQGQAKKSDNPETVSDYVVKSDEQILIYSYSDSGHLKLEFHGFAQTPRAMLAPDGQVVSFIATGVAVRLWDEPIHQVLLRDGSEATTAGKRFLVPVPARLNPKMVPNCTPDDQDEEQADQSRRYPLFIDPAPKATGTQKRSWWTLDKLCRHLMATKNADEAWVKNPDFTDLKTLLANRRPKKGLEFFDPSDPETYDEDDLILPEMDITGMAWPEVMDRVLRRYGFAFEFVLEQEEDGSPINRIVIYRVDNAGPLGMKQVSFGDPGPVDASKFQLNRLLLERDYRDAHNAVIIDSELDDFEASFLLYPLFEVGPESDADNAEKFNKANFDESEDITLYRYWGMDELERGHSEPSEDGWEFSAADQVRCDFRAIWPDDVDGNRTYPHRLRPGSMKLLSKDANGNLRKAALAMSRDYDGPLGTVWDGSGTWQEIPHGWELLDDQLGIRLNSENLEKWNIGESAKKQNPSDVCRVVTSMAKPDDTNKRFFLRLTTRIKGDKRVIDQVYSRLSSTLKYSRWQVVNAKDDFGNAFVHESSPYFLDQDGSTVVIDPEELQIAVQVKDDTSKARAYADQLQQAHENPPVAGSITIPTITSAYKLGDKISKIKGRELDLAQNAGIEQGEGPRYPIVVGIDKQITPEQATILHLSDRRAEPFLRLSRRKGG